MQPNLTPNTAHAVELSTYPAPYTELTPPQYIGFVCDADMRAREETIARLADIAKVDLLLRVTQGQVML